MEREYQVCAQCVMDTSDPEIRFDSEGICHHCRQNQELMHTRVFTGEQGKRRINEVVASVKREGKGKDYDCIIGVSGGVDSTYVAYLVKKFGLRPLAVHLDNGWNSELAVKNIENVLRALDIDLYTHVLDWEEFRDLQLAFLKASTPDSEIPSDHAIVALMRRMARKIGVRYIISGCNVRTETHVPLAWSQGHQDWKYIRSVHQRFGSVPLRSFPHLNLVALHHTQLTQLWVDILDYVDYVKRDAMTLLEEELGWRYYGGKHYESIYTRFYQGNILPTKFGYDKRRSHFSSLICAGEMTREDALLELTCAPYPSELQTADREYVVKKLGLTDDEFEAIMQLPPRSYWDYPSYGRLYRTRPYQQIRRIYHLVRSIATNGAPSLRRTIQFVPERPTNGLPADHSGPR
jgi:N-acetyl sugar amidotransferase